MSMPTQGDGTDAFLTAAVYALDSSFQPHLLPLGNLSLKQSSDGVNYFCWLIITFQDESR